MSFGLRQSFGRLCRLEEARRALDTFQPFYEDDGWLWFWDCERLVGDLPDCATNAMDVHRSRLEMFRRYTA